MLISNVTVYDARSIYKIEDYYVVCGLSAFFSVISLFICIVILVIVWKGKARFHTINYLLVCNTCIASILYTIIIHSNYIFLIFIPTKTDDFSCRWRAFFAYSSIAGVVYSYVLQALSRLFWSFNMRKYRGFTSFRLHYVFILFQWIIVLIIASPSVITEDITFYPNTLCWVSFDHPFHVGYTVLAYYIAPIVSIIFMYIYLYHRVRRTIKSQSIEIRRTRRHNVNLDLLRNILVLLSIYLCGGLSFLIFVLTSIKTIYLINLVTLSLTLTIEKICTIIFDRELRQIFKRTFRHETRVVPFNQNIIETNNINPLGLFKLKIFNISHRNK